MSNERQSIPYRIGYAFAASKDQTVIQPSLITKATEHGIALIRIDPDNSLSEQGPFDCIIHKLYGPEWTQQLEQFSSKYPDVTVIDPPELIERLHDRLTMLEVVPRLKADLNEVKLSVPNQAVVSGTETFKEVELRFPLIAKPLLANGTQNSHQMYLIFDNEGIQGLEAPILLQEFVNHGGVMFKVYVAGSSVKCVKRRSLPDISQGTHMSKPLNGSLPLGAISSSSADDGVDLETVEVPTEDFVTEVARAMREGLGLKLFNFDMIRDGAESNEYYVVDINYLPGYEKIPGYVPFFMDFLLELAQKNSREEIGTISTSEVIQEPLNE